MSDFSLYSFPSHYKKNIKELNLYQKPIAGESKKYRFLKQVNWKFDPGVKYYKFKMLYTKLVMLKIKISGSVF